MEKYLCILMIDEYKYLSINNFKRNKIYYKKLYSIVYKLNLNEIHEKGIKYF